MLGLGNERLNQLEAENRTLRAELDAANARAMKACAPSSPPCSGRTRRRRYSSPSSPPWRRSPPSRRRPGGGTT